MTSRSGFTLLELMIVIIVAGLLSAVVMLSIGGNPHRQAAQEAQRLEGLVQMAADEAVSQNIILRLEVSMAAYRFTRYDPHSDTWLPASDKLFAPHRFPEGQTVALRIDHNNIHLSKSYAPAGLFMPSGESTPFLLSFGGYQIIADGLNPVRIYEEKTRS